MLIQVLWKHLRVPGSDVLRKRLMVVGWERRWEMLIEVQWKRPLALGWKSSMGREWGLAPTVGL